MATNNTPRIVFFGTPDFAVASLKALVEAGHTVVAVVTSPDKPAGRGMQLQASAVKQYAESVGLPVMQPEKMKAPEFLTALSALHADLQVVVAFRMMPEAVWNMPPMGTINVHASLLPQYRGAAPINRAIMNGETETGVTTFKLKHEIDTGDILLQAALPILPTDTAGTLHDKLMAAGASLLVRTVAGLAAGTIEEQPQKAIETAALKPAPKLFKEDLQISWERPAADICNFIRGLSPYPAAHTRLAGKGLKVFSAHQNEEAATKSAGEFDTDHSTYLRFAANDYWVYITELQQEGKKRLHIVDFLRGFRL